MSEILARVEHRDDIALIVVDNPPVNALSQAVREGLNRAVVEIAADESVKGAVLVCAGRTFIAGADIKEFGKGPLEPSLPDTIATMETLQKPIVAALHGTALGGGLEVALGCHYRVIDRGGQVGLPEVTLGIIPGAGGTQRLPRLTGIEQAIELITSGKRIGAEKALAFGIADKVVDGDLTAAAIAFLKEKLSAGEAVVPVSARPVGKVDQTRIGEQIAKVTKKARGQLSPVKAAESVANTATLSFADGMARERAIFEELVASDQSKALRYAFFAERAVSKVPGLEDAEAKEVRTVGIVGAGTMGSGIAVAFADAGMRVIMSEMSGEAADAGRDRIDRIYADQVQRGRLTEDMTAERQMRITIAVGLEALAGADLVVEAVFEDLDVKKDLFARLDGILAPGAVLATNTSYLDIDAIAAATSRPDSVCGMHFFSPANVMKLLEVVRAAKTDDRTVKTALDLARRIGKVAVLSGVCDGFIGNRIWAAWRKQAEFLVEDGAYPEDIDAAVTAFGFPMGPFAVYDLSGLDIAWAQRKRHAATRDPAARYVEIPDRICELGRFGRKTGAGWYDYSGGGAPAPDPSIRQMIEAHRDEKGIVPQHFTAEDIQRRMRATMVNEGANILAEKIAHRPLDVDMVMLFGYGYPRWRGGPMFEADLVGLPQILEDVREMCAAGGHGFAPSPLLVELAESGKSFADWAEDK
ncbi:3-hydroxyacyl-CoA dehydrogenase NAD-binding domain-containing protein [Rhodobium gokarnense]|uniref:3-hydroxyacyl-CoA dehydrogenase n=1 Tax=Rhodobium gokarnense TaxID=364296 RepID=A0ABT3HFR6_9HYPH|nr:3-hydroxyacyl-CoA dehydrogenase NAD-binding domain-containing protein [Rhodobium gokarnense]MCW2309246.1 3-hydroxyacyl-CoA dehydrogenase [Rhodobium gokarnense]